MNNSLFGKTMEIIWKDRDINLVATGRRRDYLVPEPNYHINHLLAIEMRKTHSILVVNKTVM